MTADTVAGRSRTPDSELAPQLAVVRDWPKRAALLVGIAGTPALLAAMHRHGLTAVEVDRDQAELVAAASSFAFLIVTAASLTTDEGVERVRSLHRLAPPARLLLACPPRELDTDLQARGARAGVHQVLDPADVGAVDQAIRAGLRDAGRHGERVLAIGAQPDDVETGCGGTLFDHQFRGDRISILTLSRGAPGPHQLDRLRAAAASAQAFGAQLLYGDLPHSGIGEHAATVLIAEVVRSLEPSVVYIHSIHDSRDDKRSVSAASAAAASGVGRVFAYQSPSATDRFRPTRFVPIDAVLRRKVDALLTFGSDGGRSYLEPELVIAGSRYWARHLGSSAGYAEPFEVVRSVGELRYRVS